MFKILSRVPENLQRPIASGLCAVAFIATMFGAVAILDFTEKTKTSGHLMWKETHPRTFGDRLPSLVGGIALLSLALLCVLAALALITAHGRLKKYPAILKGVEAMKVHQIASISNASDAQVYRDIQTLIDSGIVSDFYIDYGSEQVVNKKYIPESSRKTVISCRACGAHNELIVGITRVCGSCGEPLILNAQ